MINLELATRKVEEGWLGTSTAAANIPSQIQRNVAGHIWKNGGLQDEMRGIGDRRYLGTRLEP